MNLTFTASHVLFICSLCSQWHAETQEFCPNAKVVLVGCKLDMRTDMGTLRELSKQRLIPVPHEQVHPYHQGIDAWIGGWMEAGIG